MATINNYVGLKRKILKMATEAGFTAKVNKSGGSLALSVKSDRWHCIGGYSLIAGRTDDETLSLVRRDLANSTHFKLGN